MPQARILFIASSAPAAVRQVLHDDGWTLETGAELVPGNGVVARYDGGFPRSAVDRLASELARAGADYVAVGAGGVDPAMDTPVPAWIEVGARWQVEGRALRLPTGYRLPAIDAWTLTAAGMPAEEAAGCMALLSGGWPDRTTAPAEALAA